MLHISGAFINKCISINDLVICMCVDIYIYIYIYIYLCMLHISGAPSGARTRQRRNTPLGRTLEASVPKMSGLVKKVGPFSRRKNPL